MRDDYAPNLELSTKLLATENNSILLYYKNLENANLKIGDYFVWVPPGDSRNEEDNDNTTKLAFKIQGEFFYWPNLLEQAPWNPQLQFFAVIDINTYHNITDTLAGNADKFIDKDRVKLYIKGSDTLNFTYFKESLENSDEVDRVDSYAESVKTIRSNPMFLLIIGQINSNLIYSL